MLVQTERSLESCKSRKIPATANIITTSSTLTANITNSNSNGVCPDGTVATTCPYTYTFVPFNENTVITGNVTNWYNPLMFGLNALGQIGTSRSRSIVRSPNCSDLDFSW